MCAKTSPAAAFSNSRNAFHAPTPRTCPPIRFNRNDQRSTSIQHPRTCPENLVAAQHSPIPRSRSGLDGVDAEWVWGA
eukprot:2244999-Rhodomonas_salina.1